MKWTGMDTFCHARELFADGTFSVLGISLGVSEEPGNEEPVCPRVPPLISSGQPYRTQYGG
jgi:hypothetical protein